MGQLFEMSQLPQCLSEKKQVHRRFSLILDSDTVNSLAYSPLTMMVSLDSFFRISATPAHSVVKPFFRFIQRIVA